MNGQSKRRTNYSIEGQIKIIKIKQIKTVQILVFYTPKQFSVKTKGSNNLIHTREKRKKKSSVFNRLYHHLVERINNN